MANHVLRFTTLFGSMFASATALGAPQPYDRGTALPPSEELVMHAIDSCGKDDRVCTESPLDLNGDGYTDMVVGVNQSGSGAPKRFYAGRGSAGVGNGLFSSVQLVGLSTTTSGIKFADLDNDGDLDMVESVRGSGAAGTGTNSVYVNLNGTYTSLFSNPQALDNTNDRSSSVAIGDVDGDGKLDIIIGNETTGTHATTAPVKTNYLYLNTTAAPNAVSFGPAITLDLPGTEAYTRRVLLIDVDGDKDLDLVATSADTSADDAGNGNVLYVNTGCVGANCNPFAAAAPLNANPADDTDVANAIAASDLDSDGDPDLVFSTWKGLNRYYINNSTPVTINFETTGTFGISASHTNLRFGDFDNDGDHDLIALASNISNRLYRKTSTTAPYFDAGVDLYEPDVRQSRSLDVADLNADGSLDVVVANRSQVGLRYLNNDQCSAGNCGAFNGPFDNYIPAITGQPLPAVIPAGLAAFDVDDVLASFAVTDTDNVYRSDFSAVVEQPHARYTCTDGLVPAPSPIANTCLNGRITPTSASTDPIVFNLRVWDGQNSSNSFSSATLTVGGSAPMFTTAPTLPAATEDAVYSTTVAATDGDGDANLTFTANELLPTWLQLSSSGTLSSVTPPTQGDVGNVTLSLRVTDSTGLGTTQPFTVTVNNVNDKPKVLTATLPNGTENQSYTATGVEGTDEDPGTTLSFFATGLPNGMSIASGTGVISGTPTVSGTFPIALTVSDGTLTSDPVNVPLTIAAAAPPANSPPVFTPPPAQSGTVGVAYTLSLAGSATDANSDPLTFSATGLPPGIALSPAGLLSGSPTTATGSPFTATVTVSDGKGGQASGSFQFTIVNPTSGGNSGGGSGGGGGSLGFLDLLAMLGLGAFATRRRRMATGPGRAPRH
jgi:hypothetical protein